ncbi:hypothetical protein O181_017639 [Austropuccinia psidii MF-1]|uniref:Uncharacterized protein n=1 Tax=Austropuccinia psidii MF-1 TaxID=1389203 RepID=A0A9Q3GSZ3_9BASI|nr:hypothetical protein [Austropuccinia psidii MF-1]
MKNLWPKEANYESNDDSTKAGSSPSASQLIANFRAKFRFLSPGRPTLTLPLPLPTQVKEPPNLSEDIPPTCSDTKVAESKVASEKNQITSTIENEIEGIPMQDKSAQGLDAEIPSLSIDTQPSQTYEPQLVLSLSETVTENILTNTISTTQIDTEPTAGRISY